MQVSKHIHAIKIPFQVTTPTGMKLDRFVYAYLIYGKKVYLIDTGVANSEITIFNYLSKTGRKPDEIAMLILTHSHPDHIGAAQAIQKASGCTVVAHQKEKAWIEDVELQSKERPVPGFHNLVQGSVNVDQTIGDGEILNLEEGLTLKVFHTPGHSKGSISLLLQEDKALFSGDAIPLAGDIPIYEDVAASLRSIQQLKAIDGISLLLASWDDPRNDKEAYKIMDNGLNYLRRIHDTVIKIAGKKDAPQNPLELCKEVLDELGLPQIAANPLVAASFEAHLREHKSWHKNLEGF